ncbi:MAG: peptidase S41, partial [Terriglobales bacterium]
MVAALAACLAGQSANGSAAQTAGQAAMTQPSLSPDGSQVAFAAESAIWTAPAAGGAARLLISSAATESRPLYSPDGKWLAFDSTRTGNGDIYLFELASGHLTRLTWDDSMDALDGWSPDSQWVYFSSNSHNVGGMNDIYRVRTTGGTPMIVTSERYESEYDAAAAPSGQITFCSVGEMALSQWWRKGEAHIDQTEIWNVDPATMKYTKLVAGGAKQIWPMWTPDGRILYFMSDRNGAENIWMMRGGQAPQPVTQFRVGRVLWPAMAADGKAIVFERDFGIWKLDLRSGRAAAISLRLEGAPPATGISNETLSSASEVAVSPDGKKLAFTAHGEVFAVGSEHGGISQRITHSGKLQFDMHWSPDSRMLAYISDRDGHDHVYAYNFVTRLEKQLTNGDSDESHLAFSPDGKWLGFQRGNTELLALDPATGQAHAIARGHFGRPPLSSGGVMAWSPDSQYVAYLSTSDDMFDNAFMAPASGNGAPQQVSYVPNSFGGSLGWSPDAKYLLFQTGQRTEPTRIARVDLVPQLPLFREDQFEKLFQELPASGRRGGAAAVPPAPKTTILYSGIAERLSLLPMLNARSPRISPDGKWLAYVGGEGFGGNIYVYSLDEAARLNESARGAAPKQLTSTTGGKQDLQFTADSKEIYYLEGGKVHHVAVSGGEAKAVAVSAELEVNFDREKEEAFQEAWRYLRDNYMNPTMNGVNWDEVRARYAPEVAAARTEADFRWLMAEMIGELNSSHSGISGGPPAAHTTGHLGVFFDRAKYESAGQFGVTEVVPLSPAALGG